MIAEFQLINNFILKNGELNSFKAGQLILTREEEVNSLFNKERPSKINF